MNSSLRRTLSHDHELMIVTVEATHLVQQILEASGAYPSSMIHLGQAALGALMVQALNDPSENEKVELQWRANGIFGSLNAASDAFGGVRASIAQPQVLTEQLEVSLGVGSLSCRKVKQHVVSSGIVQSSGHVAPDIEDYFRQSEQKHCAVGMSVKLNMNEKLASERPYFVEWARGYLLHFLPTDKGVSEQKMLRLDHHLQELGPLSQWVLDDDAARATLTMARFISGSPKVLELHETSPKLMCRCTQERVEAALRLLNAEDRKHLLQSGDPQVVVKCEYCGRVYQVASSEFES